CQAGQAGSVLAVALGGREQAGAALVAGADRGLAEGELLRRPGDARGRETIYLSLFVQSRGALRKELARCLRTGRAWRRPRGLSVRNGQGRLCGTVHISQRPAEANDRAVPGHWASQWCCQAVLAGAGGVAA